MSKPFVTKIVDRFNRFLLRPGDTKEDLLIAQIWFILAMVAILYPLTEAILLAVNGIYEHWYLRIGIVVTVSILMFFFLREKRNIDLLGFLLSLDIILLPGIIQYLKGGLLHSSGIVFIMLTASILALTFTSARKVHMLFGLFLLLTLGGTFLQPYMWDGNNTYSTAYKAMYIAKFLTGTLGLYLVSLYFQAQVQRIKNNEKKYLQELDAAKTKFYTNMTHEFRTPLTMILGWAENVFDHPDKNFKEGIETIQRNGKKLLNMVNQLMDISKLEAGSLHLHCIQGDILPFIKSIVEEHRGVAELRDIKVHYVQNVESVTMDHDEEKIEAVIVNILSNAIKFTPEDGDIYIQTDVQDDEFILTVRDTGPGIPHAHLPHIFNRFYQVDDAPTRKSGGSGIGLAVTRGLVELMGGTISATSLPGEGATFVIQLPITHRAMSNAPVRSKRDGFNVAYDNHTHPVAQADQHDLPLILIIEDNAEMLHFLETIIHESYNTLSAQDGRKGLEIAREHIPDLIISDIMMPVMDGYDVCKALKEDIRTSHIPIILLTAKADMDSRIQGLEMGAEAYLTKPFSKRELLVRIRKLFEMRKNLQEYYWTTGAVDEGKGNGTRLSVQESTFLQKIKTFLEEHLSDPELSVSGLGEAFHMSYSQLYRKVRSLTGRTPVQVIRELRLRQAKNILKSTEMSIGETAYQVGIEDPVYFTRIFKKAYGVTPSEYQSANVRTSPATQQEKLLR